MICRRSTESSATARVSGVYIVTRLRLTFHLLWGLGSIRHRGLFLLLELLLGAAVENGDQHVGDCDDVSIVRAHFAEERREQSFDILFSPTNGKLHVNTSMKFGSQYGCGVQLNCRMLRCSSVL